MPLVSFKTELKLNNQQKTLMAKHAGVARHAYNYCSVKKNILVGEDRAKGKGQRAKGENFNEIFFLHSKF